MKMLEFGMIELDGGDFLEYYTDDKETAFIMLEGHCDVEANGEKWENIGNRNTVFENRKAESFYMPREQKLTITARDHIKIAVCASSHKGKDRAAGAARGSRCVKTIGRCALSARDQLYYRPELKCQALNRWRGLCYRGQLGRLSAPQARYGQYAEGVHSRGNLLLPV